MSIIPRSRRLTLVAAAVLIGLSSCGSSPSTVSSPGSSSGTGSQAVVTTSTPPEPVVIQISGEGRAVGESMSAGSTSSADASISADSSASMMVAYVRYVYGGDAVDLTAPAASWFFAPGATPSDEQVLAVARAFGIEGEVRSSPADRGSGWTVGSDDYAEPSVSVGTDAMLSWWFNPGYDEVMKGEACMYVDPAIVETSPGEMTTEERKAEESTAATAGSATAIPADESPAPDGGVVTQVAPVCDQPDPPANVPTTAEAEAMATELLTSLGLSAGDYEFETYADEWSANVTAYLVIDGIRTSVSVGVGYGSEGAVTWAGGFLATPQRGADYPRIGVDAGIERLNNQNLGWLYGKPGVSRLEGWAAADVDAPATTIAPEQIEPNVPIDTVLPADVGVSPEPIMPPDVEPTTVTLDNARPSLEQLWAADQTVWLLPGYAFDTSDGGTASVIAVEDRYIDVEVPVPLPEPLPAPVPSTDPATDPSGGDATSRPATTIACASAVPLGAPVETPVTTDAGVDPATQDPGQDPARIVGLCTSEAIAVAEKLGYVVRIARQDGVDFALTDDYSENRLNIAVQGDVVTEIISIG
ncbi:MAG: hypothetical protein ABIW84_08765 [Ilumatobacteraceae bacterium]